MTVRYFAIFGLYSLICLLSFVVCHIMEMILPDSFEEVKRFSHLKPDIFGSYLIYVIVRPYERERKTRLDMYFTSFKKLACANQPRGEWEGREQNYLA